MTRITDFIKGLFALAILLLLLVGVPAALVTFVGNPIDDLREAFEGGLQSLNGQVSLLLRGGLTIVAWLAWTQVAYAIVAEMVALGRGRIAGRSSMLPGLQGLARRLVVSTTLLVQAFTTSATSATALLPLAVPPPAETVELDLLRPLEPGMPQFGVDEAASGPTFTTAAGDTFWSLAESLLGDGLRWSEIRELNLGRTMPDGTMVSESTEVVRGGWELVLPSDAVIPLETGPERTQHAGLGPMAEVAAGLAGEKIEVVDGADGFEPGDVIGTWEVEKGDHFWAIAEETLTTAYGREVSDEEIAPYWREIIDANRDRLVTSDPDMIHPGQEFDVLLPPLGFEGLSEADGELAGQGGLGGSPLNGDDGLAGKGAPLAEPSLDAPSLDAVAGDTGSKDEWTVPGAELSGGDLAPLDPEPDATTIGPITVDGKTVALGLFGTAIGGGALLELLRRRRARAAARRQPGHNDGLVPDDVDAFENRIRPVADVDAVRWLDVANRYVAAQVTPDRDVPAVLAMRAGQFGVEVLLDDAFRPPQGFIADGESGAAWRLPTDQVLDDLEADVGRVDPYCPALLPVGETDAGDLLVDFEQLAVLSLEGDLSTIAGWLASLTTAATTMSWSSDCTIYAIGVDTVLGGSQQVQVPTDTEAWAATTLADIDAEAKAATASPYRHRAAADPTPSPTFALIGPGYDDLARRVASVAELANSSLVLITTTAIDGHARIELHPDRGVIVPDETGVRLEFTPVTTGSATVRFAATMLGGRDAGRHADVANTVQRRSGGAVNGVDEYEGPPLNQWPAPIAPSAKLSLSDPPPVSAPDLAASPASIPPPVSPSRRPGDVASPAATPELSRGEGTEAERRAILSSRPIEAQLLADRPTISGAADLGPAEQAVAIYLATVRSAQGSEIASLFGSSAGQRSDHELALAAVSRSLGLEDGDDPLVAADGARGAYVVPDDVGSDLGRLEALVALAGRAADEAEELACLEAALGLVVGQPASRADRAHYGWVYRRDIAARIETAVVDAAHRLGVLALDAGRPGLASWAADRGVLAVPGQEALHRHKMRAAAAAGDREGIDAAYRAAVEGLRATGLWDELHPETENLYRELAGPVPERS